MTVKLMVHMKKNRKLGRGVAIVGAGMSKFGMYKDKDSKDLFADAFNGMVAQGYNRKNPCCTGVVELEEGTKVDARIEGVDCAKPEDIKVGMPLKVKYLQREEGEKRETYLAFEPA